MLCFGTLLCFGALFFAIGAASLGWVAGFGCVALRVSLALGAGFGFAALLCFTALLAFIVFSGFLRAAHGMHACGARAFSTGDRADAFAIVAAASNKQGTKAQKTQKKDVFHNVLITKVYSQRWLRVIKGFLRLYRPSSDFENGNYREVKQVQALVQQENPPFTQKRRVHYKAIVEKR